MERQQNNQQISNKNSDDLITFLNSNHSSNNTVHFNSFLNDNHQNSNNSVDFNSFLIDNHQNSNNFVDFNSFLNNNHQYSSNDSVDLTSFFNNDHQYSNNDSVDLTSFFNNDHQYSNNDSFDLTSFFNNDHQYSNNDSVDLTSFFNNDHQYSNNDSVDLTSFFNNNLQYSNNTSVDLTSFLNNQQNGSIGNYLNGGYQQPARALYQSSTYQNLDSETLLQNMAIGFNGLSINDGASSNHLQRFRTPNGLDNGLAIGNNFLPESAYPPVLPNQLASLSTIDSNFNNIVIGANPQVSINGNNFSPKSPFPPPALPDLRHRQPSTRPSTIFQPNLIQGLDLISRSALSVWGYNHLQKILEEGDAETKDWIITKVTPDLPILMTHHNGSEFAHALFKSCDKQQIGKILHSVVLVNESLFITICKDYCGKESAKALIENVRTDDELMNIILYVMRDHICSFTNSINAKQVLEFFIKVATNFCRQLLFNTMASKCAAIGTDRVGCYVLQDCICTAYIESNLLPYLLHSIVLNSPYLSEDIHGNYVVQCAISSGIACVNRGIAERLQGRFKALSKSVGGSNVVEKCLRLCEDSEVEKIVEELLMDSTVVPNVVQDAFGNFVIQTALQQLHQRGIMKLYHSLVKSITDNSLLLSNHLYGRKVFHKIRELSRQNKSREKFQ